MRVLVIGNGAREHTIAWKLSQSSQRPDLFCAPGNAGTSQVAQNVALAATDVDGLLQWARAQRVDLTVVGPEAPLVAGLVDRFQEAGLVVFGPSRAAAAIEGSKIWAKQLMQRYGIPTARAEVFERAAEAREYVMSQQLPIVVKADGLAAGKGVVVASSLEEALAAVDSMMEKKVFGAAGAKLMVEECMVGREVSLLAFTDGQTVVPMVPACDYKRVGDADVGANTGGMGAYSPPSFFPPALQERVVKAVLEPAVRGMAAEGCPYTGVLYAGLMLTADGPKVLEFNARLGDPETQVMLPRLKSDLLEVMLSTVRGELSPEQVTWDDEACCGIVLASGGYPGPYQTGFPISGLETLPPGVEVFHAGTAYQDGRTLTAGGRVLTVTARARDVGEARERAYAGVARISFEGLHFRRDIALREVA